MALRMQPMKEKGVIDSLNRSVRADSEDDRGVLAKLLDIEGCEMHRDLRYEHCGFKMPMSVLTRERKYEK